jgi:uncharacterized surface protein with fasciclin (FAS1) repeats
MKYITNSIKIGFLLAFSAMMILTSCNKDVEQFPNPAYVAPVGAALGDTIASMADDSLYYKVIIKSGLLPTINTKTNTFTMFVPNNAAMRNFINLISGGATVGFTDAQYVAFINSAAVSAATAGGIVSYNMIPQSITMASVPGTFPNWFYPTNLNPTSGASFNPLVRLTTSPSTRNGNWVNNVPLVTVNTAAANGIIHTTGAVAAPPSAFLWNRISTDADMTYFTAAVQRADSGVNITTSASLQWALSNLGPNLNVFVPTNAAFVAVLTAQITAALIAQGVPAPIAAAQAAALASTPGVFSNPALYSVLTAQTVKGIVVYHMMGARVFLNNFPTTATAYPTLLNGAVPTHPGVTLNAVFTGGVVTSATVKGVVNATAATITINPFPTPLGTSDQHFINGTLHKISQVLLPQ